MQKCVFLKAVCKIMHARTESAWGARNQEGATLHCFRRVGWGRPLPRHGGGAPLYAFMPPPVHTALPLPTADPRVGKARAVCTGGGMKANGRAPSPYCNAIVVRPEKGPQKRATRRKK